MISRDTFLKMCHNNNESKADSIRFTTFLIVNDFSKGKISSELILISGCL